MFTIGSLKLRSRFILAPMSGITDLPFRLLNRRFGCELAFVEMINARSLGYKSKKTQRLLSTNDKDRPLGVQLLGKESDYLLRALDILNRYNFDLLDFNAACPAPKVTRRGEGASLLKDPKKLGVLLKLLVDNSPVPVTVKIRLGWD
ncbi:MAG: tRNA-dihydrouridine synthase family protein, partial [Candidatus Omnitrophica bacterium]|nr:tRNA-dihydrouridine synthase family protein [Candidatus Omnitrophota bacterium]